MLLLLKSGAAFEKVSRVNSLPGACQEDYRMQPNNFGLKTQPLS